MSDVIVLPAIQHTGSRFVRYDLLKGYSSAGLSEAPNGKTVYHDHLGNKRKPYKFTELLEKYPAIVPLRHPRRVFKSWITRKQSIDDCINEWDNLLEIVVPHNPYYLPVDSTDRDLYIGWIRKKLNLDVDDWRPRGNDVGTMYMVPEAIRLPNSVEDYLKSIDWFTNRFWRESVTETTEVKGVLFKNISPKRIEAYGYIWQPEGSMGETVQEVTEPNLIDKFRLYTVLQAIEFIEQPKEVEDVQTDIEFETLKSQAIAQGLKVDGRWSDARLEKEIKAYLSEANGNDN